MLRIGVIGAGSWGINHIRVLAGEPCTLVVAERDAAQLPRIREVAPSVRCVRDVDELWPLVDAVVIATPAATHVPLTLAALAAGKHILVEKPFALSLADARRVARAAGDRVVMVGHLMVFHPVVRRLRELVHSGNLGRPYYLQATRVNLGKLRTDETALWCFGPHDLSVIDHVIGEQPTEVSACGQAVLQPGIDDVVFVTLRYASGLLANIQLSWLHPRKERRLTLVCSSRMVEFDDVARDKLRIYDRGYDRPPEFKQFAEFLTIRDGDVHIPHVPMVEPLQAELRHFLNCVATARQPETDLASALRVTAILEAAERSCRQGGTPLEIETLADRVIANRVP
jgi:predicted dehydrogenase